MKKRNVIDYSYDSLSRLLEADYNNGATAYNYGYDVAGNMVNYDGVTRTFNDANQMTNDGTNTLTYDNNGNLTQKGSLPYTWDRANRLLFNNGHHYTYDGLGNRVQEIIADGLPKIYDYLNDVAGGLTKLLSKTFNSNVTRYVHAPRGIHAVDDGTDWNYYAQDGLGSVRAIVDDMAVVQSSMSYDPYGNPMASYGAGFGFTGEQTDANSSVFLRARYYEPQIGVFSALDAMEGKSCTPMSLNRYGYVHGNPIMMTDPSGMFAVNFDSSGFTNFFKDAGARMRDVLTVKNNPLVIKNFNSGLCSGIGSPSYGSGGVMTKGKSNSVLYRDDPGGGSQTSSSSNFVAGSETDPCRMNWRSSGLAYANCLYNNNLQSRVCPYGDYYDLGVGFSEMKYGTNPQMKCAGDGGDRVAWELWEHLWGFNSSSAISCDSFIGTFTGNVIDAGLGISETFLEEDKVTRIASQALGYGDDIASLRVDLTGFSRNLGRANVVMGVVGTVDVLQETRCYYEQGRREFATAFLAYETAKFGVATFVPYGWVLILGLNYLEPYVQDYANLFATGISQGFNPYNWEEAFGEPVGCSRLPNGRLFCGEFGQ